jgi:hypothetical protein
MRVIKPISIGDTELISSSAPETDYAVYSPATNYVVFDRVIYNHKVYECVQTPNTGNVPDVSPLFWAVVGPTNRWAMFSDNEISTQTVLTSPLTVVLKTGYVNSMALFGLVGSSVWITVRNGIAGPVVYSATKVLDGTIIADWYQYFFEPKVQLTEVVFSNLPPYSDMHITVDIFGTGTVKCGVLAVGSSYFLGETELGASIGIIDFSRKETSAAGVTSFNKRKFSKRMTTQLWLDNANLNKVEQILVDLRATPCAWIGTEVAGFEPLTVFGFYRDFSLDIAYQKQSYCHLEIEGLT